MIVNCDFSLSSQLLERDYTGVANTQHAQIATFKFAIYLEKPETQLFYYAIKTRPTVYNQARVFMLSARSGRCSIVSMAAMATYGELLHLLGFSYRLPRKYCSALLSVVSLYPLMQ